MSVIELKEYLREQMEKYESFSLDKAAAKQIIEELNELEWKRDRLEKEIGKLKWQIDIMAFILSKNTGKHIADVYYASESIAELWQRHLSRSDSQGLSEIAGKA